MAGATLSMPAGARETPATPLVPSAAARGAAVVVLVVVVFVIIHRRHTEVGLDFVQSAHCSDPSCGDADSGKSSEAVVCDEGVTGVTTSGDVSGRCPNRAVPTRTQVDPCWTADSRSPDIPADSPRRCG